MKAVHFGAGNIGRGFIGLLLSESGYEVSFIVRNGEQARMLKEQQQYQVILANDRRDRLVVSRVTGISIRRSDEVARALKEADVITTAVGVTALEDISKPLARGIEYRLKRSDAPLHVIACENGIGGSSLLKQHVYSRLHPDLHKKADRCVAFPNAAVDRIVPLQNHRDPLAVTVEPYFEWIVERSSLPGGGVPIKGVQYVDELEPYIERKLFTVNTGHCCAAYYGYLEGYPAIQDVMFNKRLNREIRQVLKETGSMLVIKHGLDPEEHDRYIDQIINRFSNVNLIDQVVRVGRSPLRKLAPNDRLVRPALQAFKHGIDTPHLAAAIAAAMLFRYDKDPEAVKMQKALQAGVESFISSYMGISPKHPLHRQIADHYETLQQRYG